MEKLRQADVAALRWAARKADEWYGNVTGDANLEMHHRGWMRRVELALKHLGIRFNAKSTRD